MRRLNTCALALAGAGALGFAGTANAAVTDTVRAGEAVDRSCHVRLAADGAKGVDTTKVTADKTGLVRARLSGRGDWDVGVFDAKTGRSVAGSAAFAANELAEGFVTKGQQLVVQSCRYDGDAASAKTTVDVAGARGGAQQGKTQIVEVATRTREAKERLQGLGLDLTEHGDADSLEVVLHGDADAATLRGAGFTYDVRIADLEAHTAANRAADARYAAQVQESELPSGRTEYRRLPDYQLELKQLAEDYPALVKPITLRYKTLEGRDVTGIEITRRPNLKDGKPVFVNMGVHHAREWPSSEHAMEFAYDLADQLRPLGADLRPGRQHPHDHRAAGQRRRLQRLP